MFDDLAGNVDSLLGNWDSLTGGGEFDDTTVETFISVTQDDPSGSPTWTSYTKFLAGDYYGRAFRFRVSLSSTTDNVTPSITELTSVIEYD